MTPRSACCSTSSATTDVYVKIHGTNRFLARGVPYADMIRAAHALIAAAPDHILWGTDWPHSEIFEPNKMPNDGELLDYLLDYAPDETIAKENPGRQSEAAVRLVSTLAAAHPMARPSAEAGWLWLWALIALTALIVLPPILFLVEQSFTVETAGATSLRLRQLR